MFLYFLGSTLVLGVTSGALVGDDSTPNDDQLSWICIAVATILWLITLPCILNTAISVLLIKADKSLPSSKAISITVHPSGSTD